LGSWVRAPSGSQKEVVTTSFFIPAWDSHPWVLSVASLCESDASVEREPQADHRKKTKVAENQRLFFCFMG